VEEMICAIFAKDENVFQVMKINGKERKKEVYEALEFGHHF
jgi:hypothetical protein